MDYSGQYRIINSSLYYIPPEPILPNTEAPTLAHESDDLVTVITRNDLNGEDLEASLQKQLQQFRQQDDVFSTQFLQRLYIQIPESQLDLAETLIDRFMYLNKVVPVSTLSVKKDQSSVSPGPYFKLTTGLHQAWRVFEDTHGAFVTALVPSRSTRDVSDSHTRLSYEPLQFPSTGSHVCVAVPSRCYTIVSTRPLDGLRFAVKDNINIRGCPTSAGSRDFERLYGKQTATSVAIARLIEMGAVLVGTTKTAQFADGDTLTADWVETSCPWNPRGDGYLIPSGSSAGSATAVAAYDWIDFTVGTDTLGSIRGPALWHGIYGIRPTWDSVDSHGMVPICRSMDTIGFLTRDLAICFDLSTSHLGSLHFNPAARYKVLCLDEHWSSEHNDIKEVRDEFLAAFERATRTTAARITMKELWGSYDSIHRHAEFRRFAGPIARDVKLASQYEFFTKFVDEFQAKFGRRPYLNPVVRRIYQMACDTVKETNVHETETRRQLLSEWINQHVFRIQGDGIIPLAVVPMTDGKVTCRDEYCAEPVGITLGEWHPKLLSSLAGVPEIVIPIGDHKYISQITGAESFLPITVSILAPKNHEIHILRVAQEALESMGRTSSVRTGGRCYHISQ